MLGARSAGDRGAAWNAAIPHTKSRHGSVPNPETGWKGDAVCRTHRNAERSHLAVRLGDVFPPRGLELETLISQGRHGVVDDTYGESVERHPVGAGSHVAGRGFDLLV